MGNEDPSLCAGDRYSNLLTGGGSAPALRRFAQPPIVGVRPQSLAPSVEVAADGRNWWKVVGQHAPLAASRRDIQDRVGQIACVSVALSGMLAAGEFGPGHGGLRSDLQLN